MTTTNKKILLARAGITPELIAAGAEDVPFDQIMDALMDIHKGKSALYGNYMETHGAKDDPELFCLMEHYCDIRREWLRAENFIKKSAAGEDIALEELLDTFSDMAVYSALGIQLVFKLMARKDEEIGSMPIEPEFPKGV